jgi:hypothetical protein
MDEYLRQRALRGSREKYEVALAGVPDVEPDAYDRLPTRLPCFTQPRRLRSRRRGLRLISRRGPNTRTPLVRISTDDRMRRRVR